MEEVFADLPRDVYILVYADDILLVAVGEHPKKLRRKIQSAVSRVGRWCLSAGFVMSAGKCVRTHVCQSNHRPPGQPIVLNGATVPTKSSVKLLGVTVDRHLTFAEHCKRTKEACKVRSNMMKLISRRRTRSDRGLRLRVADAVITSRLLYGLELTSVNLPEITRSLAPVYNRAVRLVSGHLPSTPADIACAEAGVIPFRHKVTASLSTKTVSFLEKTKASNSTCHLLGRADEAFHRTTQQPLPKITGLHRLGPRDWASRAPKIDWSLKAQLRRNPNQQLAQRLFGERINAKYRTHTVRYTDGSRAAGKVGIGVDSTDGSTQSHRLPNTCSVFSAEAAAIFQAVSQPCSGPMLIVSDSASALSALPSAANRHPFIQAIQENIDEKTTLMWVPGHAGIAGNESADILANIGRASPLITRSVPADDAKRWIKQQVSNAWANEWHKERNLCRMVKGSTLPGTDLPNRREQMVLSRLRTGHTNLTHNLGSGDFHHRCTTCQCRNTISHIINNCPEYEGARQANNIGNAVEALNNNPINERLLINFLKDSKLYYRI
ncbi:uncharacterized protein LOC134210539 [Armigeres subalbatus]|uniref:uncharacterized protein LOC134210539 n=1 Tax=Armigeres subalbatus TaxID=124917 RepID=UPI002ED1AF7C